MAAELGLGVTGASLLDRLGRQTQLPEHEAMVLESVSRLAREVVAPAAQAFDESAAFPWSNVAAITRLGLNAMFVPEAYGGVPLSYAAYLACVRELSMACASTGIIWATTCHAVLPIIAFGNEEQKQRFLPTVAQGGLGALCITESAAGSDATRMETRFMPQGDAVTIAGGKIFITNGDVADIFLVFGKWTPIGSGKAAVTALVVEKGTPGLSVLRTEKKMGHRASGTAALAFDDCRVPRANVLGAPGQGLAILLASLNKSRPSVAAHALGIARAAFEDTIAYIGERQQFGQRVIDFQGVQFLIADLASELALCEAWLWHVARLVDGGTADFAVEASILKLRASDLAMRMTTEAVQLHGGYGYCRDFRVERLMRDAKITQIWEGTNQMHRQFIGRSFIRKPGQP